MRTKGAVAVVTGAGSGLGRATAHRLSRQGARLVVAGRRREALDSLVAELHRAGAPALAVPTDVSDAEAVQRLADRAVERFGRIDIWVNCAAVGFFAPVHEVPLEDFRRVLDVDVLGTVYGSRAAIRQMRAQGSGLLVNVSSVVGEVPQPYTAAYSMSKAAVRALSTSLRSELLLDRITGVKVATVLPATYDTPWFQHAANYTGRQAKPVPPVYEPERVARAIVGLVRRPRREKIVGPMGHQMVLQHKVAPGTTEAMMAVHVERTHLSRRRAAPRTAGNLYRPSADPTTARVTGGWGGRRKVAARRAATAAALVGAGLVVRRTRR